ncbi:DNA helicase [Enterococcus phage vB_Efs6_KEN16]|uniref:DNA helicase n=1 Tax=Enterococcus phage vB_Efs6_KEN16 TaxID=3138325 RepID=A0AAX4PTN8_9CAUD
MRLVVDIMHTQIRYEDSENYLRPEIHKVMHSELGVKADGYQFSPAYKAGYWDGIIDFFDKENDTFPTGLLPHVEAILGNLQSTLSKSGYIFQFEIIDDRPDEFMSVEDMDKEIVLNGDNNDKITLRDYQYESVEQVIKNRIGIVNVSTGGGKCVVASTNLLTYDKGYKTFEQLFKEHNIDLTQSEATIPNTFGVTLVNEKGEPETPSHLTINGVRHVNKVTTEHGWTETITDNHPLLTVSDSGSFKWVEAKDLNVGDWIVGRKGDNLFGTNTTCTVESAYSLGLLTADGYCGQPTQITLTNNQPEILADIQDFFTKEGLSTKVDPNKDSKDSKIVRGTAGARELYNKYGLSQGLAKDKSIPECIMEAPKEVQLAYISGYLECEMSMEVPKCSIEVISASEKLLHQLQLLLGNMGVSSRLAKKVVKGYEANWYGRLTIGVTDSVYLLKQLTFKTAQRNERRALFIKTAESRNSNHQGQPVPFGKELVKRYCDNYLGDTKGLSKAFKVPRTISLHRLKNLIHEFPNGNPTDFANLTRLTDGRYVYSQVTSIEDMGYEPTYDLHMPETHSFIANGMINHNTEIASGLIQQITPYLESGERIAFFTNSSSIFSQSIDRIEKRLGIKVGAFGAGKKDIQQVTFVMIPTIVSAISADPEAKLKLTAKERMYKKIAKDIAPKFERGFNQRSLLEGYLNNFQVKTKADLQLKHELEEIFYSCGTNKQVIMKMKGYQAEYQKIVEKKNGKVLKKYNEAMEFLDSISVMIVDEAHHTSSDTWYKVLTSCNNAQYRMALTGSIDRTNHVLWQRLQAIFGEITTKVSNNTLIELGHSAKPKITIFPIIAPVDIQTTTYMDAYQKGIVDNEYRNSLIAKLTKKMYDKGNGILIIINRIEHGEAISNLLKEEGVAHYFINGQLENDLRDEKIQDMRDGALKVMISSTIIDEGVDISGIDTLILGAGGKSLRQTLQRVGRGLRKKKTGENKVEVFDFYDLTNKHLKKHSEQRRKIYEDEQFEIVDIPIPK